MFFGRHTIAWRIAASAGQFLPGFSKQSHQEKLGLQSQLKKALSYCSGILLPQD